MQWWQSWLQNVGFWVALISGVITIGVFLNPHARRWLKGLKARLFANKSAIEELRTTVQQQRSAIETFGNLWRDHSNQIVSIRTELAQLKQQLGKLESAFGKMSESMKRQSETAPAVQDEMAQLRERVEYAEQELAAIAGELALKQDLFPILPPQEMQERLQAWEPTPSENHKVRAPRPDEAQMQPPPARQDVSA